MPKLNHSQYNADEAGNQENAKCCHGGGQTGLCRNCVVNCWNNNGEKAAAADNSRTCARNRRRDIGHIHNLCCADDTKTSVADTNTENTDQQN